MPELMPFFDFVVDIVCLMPPIGAVDAITLTRDHAILVSFGAIGLLVLAIMISTLKKSFPENTSIAIAIAVCVIGLGVIGFEQEMLKGIFLAGYPPMVIGLRFAEGAIVGSRSSRYLRWWHSLLLVIVIAGLYYLLKPLPNEKLALVKGGWALFGAGFAAFMWSRIMANAPVFQSPFTLISIFMVFASTITYVSASSLERSLFQWTLPIGLMVGILGGRLSHQSTDPRIDREPQTKGTQQGR